MSMAKRCMFGVKNITRPFHFLMKRAIFACVKWTDKGNDTATTGTNTIIMTMLMLMMSMSF